MNNPRRRPFRSRCEILVGDQRLIASTRDISPSGIGVCVPAHELDIIPVSPNMSLTVRFALGDSRPLLEQPCDVAWVSDKSLDVRGEPAVTLGLRFREEVPEVERFVANFRHNIVLLSSNIENVHFLTDLASEDYRFLTFLRPDEAMAAVYEQAVSVLIVDTAQSDASLLKLVRTTAMNLPFAHFAVLLITDQVNTPQLETLLDLGRVLFYLRKPVTAMDLRHTIRMAVEAYVMRNENERLNAELERTNARLLAENADLRERLQGARLL